jgi:hypothetical protein
MPDVASHSSGACVGVIVGVVVGVGVGVGVDVIVGVSEAVTLGSKVSVLVAEASECRFAAEVQAVVNIMRIIG